MEEWKDGRLEWTVDDGEPVTDRRQGTGDGEKLFSVHGQRPSFGGLRFKIES